MTLWDDIPTPAFGSVWRSRGGSDRHRVLVGRNDLGQPLLMLELHKDHPDVARLLPEMTGMVADYQRFSESDRFGVVLTLRDFSEVDLFGVLCEDLGLAIKDASDERQALLAFLARLKRWQRLLARGGGRRLTADQIRGIFAELVMLEKLIAQGREIKHLLDCWKGPLGGAQDFVFVGQAIEVKASANGQRVRISSEYQLEVQGRPLTLVVVHLVAAEGGEAFSLNAMVDRVGSLMANHKGQFEDLLASAGYLSRPEYDTPTFRVVATNAFAVTQGFPTLTRQSLPAAIDNVEYDLDLTELASFQIQSLLG
jgi:hypothetical protein